MLSLPIHEQVMSIYLNLWCLISEFHNFQHRDPIHMLLDLYLSITFSLWVIKKGHYIFNFHSTCVSLLIRMCCNLVCWSHSLHTCQLNNFTGFLHWFLGIFYTLWPTYFFSIIKMLTYFKKEVSELLIDQLGVIILPPLHSSLLRVAAHVRIPCYNNLF